MTMASTSDDLPASQLMDTLMKDPTKRALILQLLSDQKDNLEKYRRQELKNKTTPLKNSKKVHCESPTALHRRRALEQTNRDSSGSSSSEISDVAVVGPKLPFDQVLKGVRAYVEVKRNNEDRSEGIKAVMKLMGATIRDKFTNDVTHVIFKDGCFTTFEKAKLLKVHLVSVLWLEAVRRSSSRVPEKNYPPYRDRADDANASFLCSQIQRDYEDVIKDERRRRHTMMTPQTSMSSYKTAQNVAPSDNDIAQKTPGSPELSSDDSDCGVIDGHSSKRSKNLSVLSSVLTEDASNASKHSGSSDSTSLLSHLNQNKRKTIRVISNMELTPNVESTSQDKSSEKIIDATPEVKRKEKNVLRNSVLQTSTVFSLTASEDTDKTKSDLVNSKDSAKNPVGKENCSVTTLNTTMSSLRLSESSAKSSNKRSSESSSRLTSASTGEVRKTPSLSSNSNKSKGKTSSRKSRKPTLNNSKTPSPFHSEDENAQQNKNKSPRAKDKNPSASTPGKLRRRTLFESSGSDVEEPQLTKTDKRAQRTPSVTPLEDLKGDERPNQKQPIRRSRRSSVMSGRSFSNTSTRSRRSSVAKTISESELTNASNESRRSSVMSTTSVSNTPNKNRRSSVAKTTSESELSDALNDSKSVNSKTPRKSRRATSAAPPRSVSEIRNTKTIQKRETVPSPAKKSRVQENTTVKKTRKLYDPENVSFSPLQEEKEREEHKKQKAQKSPDDVFVNPNYIPIKTLPNKQKSNSTNDLLHLSSDEDGSKGQKLKQKSKKKQKKEKTPPKRDSSADEQRELLESLSRATERQTRCSKRLSLSQTKPKYTFSSESTLSTSSLPITPIKRRSTLDFMTISQSQQKRKLKLDPKRTTSIVCTKMHRKEVVNFENAASKLGHFFVEDKVTGKTTHLVAGEAKRTINMLRAIARGCWILKHEWLLKSQQEGKWLNEEDYELTEFSPAVQQCRLQREAFGSLYSMDIFKDCGFIYVGKATTPKPAELKELISICQGRVTTVYRNANISVGEYIHRDGVTCVTEMWILDSILFNKLKSVKHYLLKPNSPNY